MRQKLIYLQKNGLKFVFFKQIVAALMQVINREMIFFFNLQYPVRQLTC